MEQAKVIDRALIERLAGVHGAPAVSILLGTDRHRPGDEAARLRLQAMLAQARRRLEADWGHEQSAKVVGRLERACRAVDWSHPDDAVAIFATADEDYAFQLPVPVRDRVVIEKTFATRDLVVAMQRTVRYRALVLSARVARLFEGWGSRLSEVVDGSFPFAVDAPRHTTPSHRDLPRRDPEAGAHRFVFRAVDRALNERSASDPVPVVVVAPDRDLAFFDEVTAHGRLIVARVAGDHTRATETELASLVRPYVDEAFSMQLATTVGAIEEAARQHNVALGVPAAWEAARQGRGRLLVVEEGYLYPAHLVDGKLVASTSRDGSLALDDAVDDIIESVLVNGGDAVVVEPGELGQYAPIALALRY
jgi:hypothetical protein